MPLGVYLCLPIGRIDHSCKGAAARPTPSILTRLSAWTEGDATHLQEEQFGIIVNAVDDGGVVDIH